MGNATRSTGVTSDIGPFAIVPAWLIETPGLTMTALGVYATLALYADRNTGKAHPSRTSLARRLGVSKQTVDRGLKQLVEIGAIEVEQRFVEEGDTSRQTTNGYRVFFSNPMWPVHTWPERTPPLPESEEGGGPESDDPPSPNLRSQELDHRNQTTLNQKDPGSYDPVTGRRVDGQDLPWNALADATKAYGAANGARMKRALASIRKDVVDQAGAGVDVFLERFGWEAWELAIADEITARVERLQTGSPGLTWGPEGVARNWRSAAAPTSAASIVEDVQRERDDRGDMLYRQDARP